MRTRPVAWRAGEELAVTVDEIYREAARPMQSATLEIEADVYHDGGSDKDRGSAGERCRVDAETGERARSKSMIVVR